jgi:K+-sensing histidine kinase KdpD
MDTHKVVSENGDGNAKHDEPIMWNLVADISQGLQISFASIKAAISSLLGGDIFWDQATQHEFMQTIDKSIDDISGLTAVMTIAMRAESQTLTIRREPNSLQEILSQARDLVQKEITAVPITLALPAETRLAFVDFEYLRLALRLLLEVLVSARPRPDGALAIRVLEKATEWQIIIEGDFPGSANDIIAWFCHDAPDRSRFPVNLRSETRLKALVAHQLLTLQTIRMATNDADVNGDALVLFVPFQTEA